METTYSPDDTQRQDLRSHVASSLRGEVRPVLSGLAIAPPGSGMVPELALDPARYLEPPLAGRIAILFEAFLFVCRGQPAFRNLAKRWYAQPLEFGRDCLTVERELPNRCPTCAIALMTNRPYLPLGHPARELADGFIRNWKPKEWKDPQGIRYGACSHCEGSGIETPACPECGGTKRRTDGRLESVVVVVPLSEQIPFALENRWYWQAHLNHGEPERSGVCFAGRADAADASRPTGFIGADPEAASGRDPGVPFRP